MKDTSNRKKILGMNKRSLLYIRPSNKKKSIRRADNKLETKRILNKIKIPTPQLYAVIRDRKELLEFDWNKLPDSFVVKPNMGFGGEGVVIAYGRKKNGNWVSVGNDVSKDDLITHVSNILDGNYSLANAPDIAIFEQRIQVSPLLKPYTFKGLPDIRILVYNKVPVMAMLRLPTKRSNGKANLHQGGIGVGIDIASGVTTHAITKGFIIEKEIDRHPDTKTPLRGIRLPDWQEILKLAVDAAVASKLGFTGVDIALDKNIGPVILELNARPGLSIQIANRAPLDDRLHRLKGLKIQTAERGIKIAQELFGGEIEHEIEKMSGKHIIGLVEKIKIIGKDKKEKEVLAKIDSGADITSLDTGLAQELGYTEVAEVMKRLQDAGELDTANPEDIKKLHKDIVDVRTIYSSHGQTQRILIPLTLYLAGTKIITHATIIDRTNLKYKIIIGNRNLKRFLVDSSKSIPKFKET